GMDHPGDGVAIADLGLAGGLGEGDLEALTGEVVVRLARGASGPERDGPARERELHRGLAVSEVRTVADPHEPAELGDRIDEVEVDAFVEVVDTREVVGPLRVGAVLADGERFVG